jgi:hypothetical protein
MKINTLLLLLLVSIIACNQPKQIEFKSHGKVDYPLTNDEELMLDSIQRITFLFFR